MSPDSVLGELAARFRGEGLEEVEIYRKQGRSRRYQNGPAGRSTQHSREEGWAVRAGGPRASLFAAGTGEVRPEGPWPAPDGHALRLPPAGRAASWARPADLDAPLVGESEAAGLLDATGRRLGEELPGAHLLSSYLEEGVSTATIESSRGVESEVRRRSAALFLEAFWPGDPDGSGGTVPSRVSTLLAARTAREFSPTALARRLADQLLVRGRGGTVERDRGEVLLAPATVAAVLEGLIPLLVGAEAAARIERFRDRSGRIGSRQLTLIDDGRHPGGLLEAAVDGEGVETRAVTLIDEGIWRQPLLSWREARQGERWSGCSSRPGWRDVPAAGPTHLYLRPDPSLGPGTLLRGVARGYYLLDPLEAGRFDLEGDRFELPACGFVLRRGRSAGSFGEAVLRGTVSALLRGVQAAARDLTFHPARGWLGGPTILVTGLELDGR